MAIGSKDTMAHVTRALGEGVPIRHASHPYDALVYAGAEPADAYVLDVRSVPPEVEIGPLFEALHRASPQAMFLALADEPADVPPFVTRLGRSDAQGLKGALMPEAPQPAAAAAAGAAQAGEEAPRTAAAGGGRQ
jgi:hypothetical protein